MYKLVITDDEGKTTVVPLVRDEVTIGRKEGNTIRLTERNVSRRHARLRKANGKFVVEDLQSYNGVRVNGDRIGAETSLAAGDQLTIGDYQIALQLEGAEVAPGAPAVASAETAMLALPGPPARLVMITPPAPGAEFALNKDRIRLGRAEDLDIWVNHRSISREHAEIQKEADGLRLIDLSSANGVRVNGKDVQNKLLEAGDVVELGQVRFRFVGAGEQYAFDSDRTVQMDAVAYDEPTPSRAPYMAAGLIIVLAVVGAIAVAMMGGGDDAEPTVTSLAPQDETAPGPDQQYQDAIAACQTALGQVQIPQAIEHARAALAVRPGDESATACQARAQALQAEQQHFNTGVQHLGRGELENAYYEFQELADESPFRARPEVGQATNDYAEAQLASSNDAMQRNAYQDALRFCNDVLLMPGINAVLRTRANTCVRSAQESGARPQANPVPAVAAVRPPRRVPAASDPRPRATGVDPPAPSPAAEPDPSPRPAGGGGGGGGAAGGGGLDQARQCLAQGDQRCAIRALGSARSEPELALLIETHRSMGNTAQAVQNMRRYVERYPSGRRASNYRQFLQRQP